VSGSSYNAGDVVWHWDWDWDVWHNHGGHGGDGWNYRARVNVPLSVLPPSVSAAWERVERCDP
jgi:hypothetical protein